MTLTAILLFGPAVLIGAYFVHRRLREERRDIDVREEAAASGMTEPSSLHPSIDIDLCIGCASCAEACPEGRVLGVIDGKASLVEPTRCIGHGACKDACPVDAITLVFGTERRGVDIPHIQPNFETNLPGIFIAGELGGMGLIRNAVEQGRQAVDSIRKLDGTGNDDQLDLVVVGAGPAGIAASLAAMQYGMRCVTLEQYSLGGTVASYPRGKLVMTQPAELPLVGKVKLTETTKEELLDFWRKVETDTGLKINYQERLERVTRNDKGFVIESDRETYRARSLLLAIGRRGTPRKLGIPGEESSKVTYRLIDPEQYRGRHVLVVGGGDSALEAAVALADQPGTTVHLSYRAETFQRAKQKNRERVQELEAAGKLRILFCSKVDAIEADHVRIEHEGQRRRVKNDVVLICAGGVLPTRFLEGLGIEVETKYGTA